MRAGCSVGNNGRSFLTHQNVSIPVMFAHHSEKIDVGALGFDGRELDELLAGADAGPKE